MVKTNNFPLRVYSEILCGTGENLQGKLAYYEYYTLNSVLASSGLSRIVDIDGSTNLSSSMSIEVQNIITQKRYTIVLHSRIYALDVLIPLE